MDELVYQDTRQNWVGVRGLHLRKDSTTRLDHPNLETQLEHHPSLHKLHHQPKFQPSLHPLCHSYANINWILSTPSPTLAPNLPSEHFPPPTSNETCGRYRCSLIFERSFYCGFREQYTGPKNTLDCNAWIRQYIVQYSDIQTIYCIVSNNHCNVL
jgi:hypothetical protein